MDSGRLQRRRSGQGVCGRSAERERARHESRGMVLACEHSCGACVLWVHLKGQWRESLRARKAFDLPKLFLRLLTKSQTSDLPMTLAKWFFENSVVDSKGLEFYHRHWEFLRLLGQNPSLSARFRKPAIFPIKLRNP